MNLDIVESCEHYEDNKIQLNLRIYLRKNKTLFVRKSFLWRRKSIMTTMLLFWKSLQACFFGQSLNFKSKNHKNIFIFRLFIHVVVVSVRDRIESTKFEFFFFCTIEIISQLNFFLVIAISNSKLNWWGPFLNEIYILSWKLKVSVQA